MRMWCGCVASFGKCWLDVPAGQLNMPHFSGTQNCGTHKLTNCLVHGLCTMAKSKRFPLRARVDLSRHPRCRRPRCCEQNSDGADCRTADSAKKGNESMKRLMILALGCAALSAPLY